MISPEDIRQQAVKWWKSVLQAHMRNEPFFPRSIDRIGKVHSSHVTGRFEALQQEIGLLYSYSKNQTGAGYFICTADRNFRRTGNHELPESIVFETTEDYLHCVGKKKDWKIFLLNYEQVVQAIPLLKGWAPDNSDWLTQPQIVWGDILKVCRYFLSTPRPHLYLRQLPVEVHTKFIEENAALIQSLLDFLIPGHVRSISQKRFAERYFLKYDEPLVRIRILDESASFAGTLKDVSIPLSDFEQAEWPAATVLMAENKMNFHSLPQLPSTIAVWSGGGFQVGFLRNAFWLSRKRILYWGDIDEHGFQILNQLRSYFPQTQSVMMDRHTFGQFGQFTVEGARNKAEALGSLNEDEASMYRYLKSLDNQNRLEQEKIPQAYADEALRRLFRPAST